MSFVKKLFQHLPASDIPNIRRYYTFIFFTNFWFMSANWLFYWLRFMNYQQLGIMDAVTFGVGLLMEIPSGAISDLLGKKKTIVMGTLMAFLSIIGMALSQSMEALFWAQLFLVIGWALNSGAVEALVYDTLLVEKREKEYEKVVSFATSLGATIIILAIFLGGYLYAWHFRAPVTLWGLTWGLAFLAVLGLKEPLIDSQIFSWSNYWKQLKTGVMALFKPQLISFAIVIFSLMGGYFLYDFGFIKPALATHFGFSIFQQSQVFTLLAIGGALIVLTVPWLRTHISDRKGLYLLSLLLGLGFLLSFFANGVLGFISLLLIDMSGHLVYPWISIVVNKEIESEYRATALSAVALISKIPYVLLSVVAGSFAQMGKIGLFSAVTGAVVISSILLSTLIYKKNRASVSR